eukprot:12927830-Prorocentrum_lima.AAC.1
MPLAPTVRLRQLCSYPLPPSPNRCGIAKDLATPTEAFGSAGVSTPDVAVPVFTPFAPTPVRSKK